MPGQGHWQPVCARAGRVPAGLEGTLFTSQGEGTWAAMFPCATAPGSGSYCSPRRLLCPILRSAFLACSACSLPYCFRCLPTGVSVQSTAAALLLPLCRNGPGRFTINGKAISHPYDGDGLVTSTAISGGRAFFRSRFVRTAE